MSKGKRDVDYVLYNTEKKEYYSALYTPYCWSEDITEATGYSGWNLMRFVVMENLALIYGKENIVFVKRVRLKADFKMRVPKGK